MRKFTFYFIVFILTSGFLHSQEQCTYRGMVMDSLQFPVFDVSISVFDENNKSAGFTFSD